MEAPVSSLVDQHGRKIRKLRISLTDKCNLRCHYCMPVDAKFMDAENYLTPDQYFEVVRDLCANGLEEVRLTGGEPLMRKSFAEIVEKLSSLPLKKIGMTTNAILLDRHVEQLKRCGIQHLNISLDSLNEATFFKVTNGNHLPRVLENIQTALKLQFKIKINVVSMRGVNDHELFDFVDYSKANGIEVRFLEIMRIGHAIGDQNKQFISSAELIEKLKSKYTLTRDSRDKDSTSVNYVLENGAQVGFISSESNAFCGQCSRWRLSADGTMRACLFKDDGISIKNKNETERKTIYQTLLGMKPVLRPKEVSHQMNGIGG